MHQTEALKAVQSRGLEGEIAVLRRFSPGPRVLELLVFPLLWISGSALALSQPAFPLRILGTLLAALGLNAFVLLLHEGMHGTLFPSHFWNRWTSVILGGCVLISFTAYRVMHEEHHRYLGDPRDPDEYRN